MLEVPRLERWRQARDAALLRHHDADCLGRRVRGIAIGDLQGNDAALCLHVDDRRGSLGDGALQKDLAADKACDGGRIDGMPILDGKPAP